MNDIKSGIFLNPKPEFQFTSDGQFTPTENFYRLQYAYSINTLNLKQEL